MTIQNAKRKQSITEIAGKFIFLTTLTVILFEEEKSGERKAVISMFIVIKCCFCTIFVLLSYI